MMVALLKLLRAVLDHLWSALSQLGGLACAESKVRPVQQPSLRLASVRSPPAVLLRMQAEGERRQERKAEATKSMLAQLTFNPGTSRTLLRFRSLSCSIPPILGEI